MFDASCHRAQTWVGTADLGGVYALLPGKERGTREPGSKAFFSSDVPVAMEYGADCTREEPSLRT